jgi:predicted aspartyl protease
MTNLKSFIAIVLLSLFCLKSNAQANEMKEWANHGSVTNKNYDSEIPFRYIDGYIFVDLVQNDKTYNFLFDTGAEATLIDQSILHEFDYKPFSTSTISGPVITNQDVKTIVISSIYISDVEFVNIAAVSIELNFAKSKFCHKLDGIIGSTILKKSKWQIDYEKKVIRFSNAVSNLLTSAPTFTLTTHLPVKGWGTETIELNIDGYVSHFNFDTGNGREKIISHPSKLKQFSNKHMGSVREYGLKKSATDYKFLAQTVTLGNLELNNQSISLQNEVGNQQLLGNRFFENFLVTIDWEKHRVYLYPIQVIPSDTTKEFELKFKPNFVSNKIEIATGLKAYTKQHKIDKGALLLKVNEIDISNLSPEAFCAFWSIQWPEIIDAKKLKLVISQKGKSKELVVNKSN